MKEVINTTIKLVVECALYISIFYVFLCIKMMVKKPKNVYKIAKERYEKWYKRNLSIHWLLAGTYFLIFLAIFAGKLALILMIPLIVMLVVLYVARVRNNMLRLQK